jgi:hypothetical protein
MATITVYSFKAYDIEGDTNDPRPVKATLEKIRRIHAEEIPGTEEEIDESMLDGIGFYRPEALGPLISARAQ